MQSLITNFAEIEAILFNKAVAEGEIITVEMRSECDDETLKYGYIVT